MPDIPDDPDAFAIGSEVRDLDNLLAEYRVAVQPQADQSLCVLLLEPDRTTRRALREKLEAAGHAVLAAPAPAGAMQFIAEHPVDVIVADARVDASGCTVPGIPFVVMPDDAELLLAAIRNATRSTP